MYEWEFRRGWKEERVIIVSISCETKRRIKRGIERIMEENGILFQRDLAGLRVKYVKASRSFFSFQGCVNHCEAQIIAKQSWAGIYTSLLPLF